MPNIIKEKGVIMAKKKKEQGESSVNENEDSKQDKLIMELLDELPLIRTENHIEVQIKQKNTKEIVPIDDERVVGYILHEAKDRYNIWAKPSIIKNCIMYKKYCGYDLGITELKHRIAYHNDSIIYDLIDGDCVVVNKSGWRIEENNYLFFRNSSDKKPQVKPIPCPNGWQRLKKYINLPEDEKILFIAYMIACFNPNYTFPSVCINGASGSGKSTLTKLLKKVIDPVAGEGANVLTTNFDDLKVLLDNNYYVAFDNLSKINNSISNFFCTVVTGGTFTTRKKYEDNKTFTITLKQGLCLNGIGNFVINDDFVDRAIFFNTKPFAKSKNYYERDLIDDLDNDMPYILGGVFEVLSKALSILPSVKIDEPIRLADFHRFGFAVAEAMGGYGNTFNQAISRNKEQQMAIVDENFEIVRILIDFLKENDGEWSSTVDMLYKSVRDFVILADEGKYDEKAIPKASNAFSRMLSLHEAHLAKRGYRYDIKKNGVGRHVITFYTDMIIRKPITGIREPIILKDSTRELTSQLIDSLIADIEESEK